MSILQIELFGVVRVTHDNWITEMKIAREIQPLLAYLLLYRHRVHSRDVLADMFWGEYNQTRARGSLNTALWKLRKVLEPEGIPAGSYLKNVHLGEVGFNREGEYWLDAEVFEEQINRILSYPLQTVEDKEIIQLDKALTLYKGELMEGVYQDWALRERERLHDLYLSGLILLLQYYGLHRVYDKAIAYGHKILSLSPIREDIHREMMKLYLASGQRALAVQQYEICRSTLAKELGIPPMEDTQALYTEILAGAGINDSLMNYKKQINLDQAFQQLKHAIQNIELAKENTEQALEFFAKYLEESHQRFSAKGKDNN